MPSASTRPPAEAGAGPGVWLPLPRLRELPLAPAALLALLEELQRSGQPAGMTLASPAQLAVEAVNLAAQQVRQGLETGALAETLEALERLLHQVARLAALQPEQAELLWKRYVELLGQGIAAVHGAVFEAKEGATLEPALRADLCWGAMQCLKRVAPLPLQPPEWLPVLEQQLVQEGATLWSQQEGSGVEERSLDLYLRLGELLDPVPEWVAQSCRDRLTPRLKSLIEADTVDADVLAPWLERLARMPLEPERRQAFEAAILRARMSLELIQLAQRPLGGEDLEVVEAEWLQEDEQHEEPVPGTPLQLVLSSESDSELTGFCLEPFLDGDLEGAEAALAEFLEQEAGIGRPALEPVTSLLENLRQQPRRLLPAALPVICQAAAQWQEAVGEHCEPLPAASWRAAGVVELEATELLLLHQLVHQRPEVEEGLIELRRRHHDGAFWEEAEPSEPPACWTVLQTLRTFHRSGGFYASSHAPMESLLRWAQPALAALGQAQVWSRSAAVAGLWLPLALESAGAGATTSLVGPLEAPELLESLGGQEVVLVGEQSEAVREAHRQGQLFVGESFGLRCLEPPASRQPLRPAAGFEDSLAESLAAVEALYRERPFDVLLTDSGAYRLPLALAARQRFGVGTVCAAVGLAGWLQGPLEAIAP